MLLFLKCLFCLAFGSAPRVPAHPCGCCSSPSLLVSLKARPPDLRPLRPPRSSTPSACMASSIPRSAVPPVHQGSPGGTSGKESRLPAQETQETRVGSIPGWEDPPGGGTVSPLQHSCLGNPVGRGASRATVHRVTKHQTRLKH